MKDVFPNGKVTEGNGVARVGKSEVSTYVSQSGRSGFDAWLTKMAFRCMLIKRAYSEEDFILMAEESRFRACRIDIGPIGLEVRFTKPARAN